MYQLPDPVPTDAEALPPRLSPAGVVHKLFGIRPLARSFGISPVAVWRWNQPHPKGSGGRVPSVYHVPLLEHARHRGLYLTSEDLVLGRQGTDATSKQ